MMILSLLHLSHILLDNRCMGRCGCRWHGFCIWFLLAMSRILWLWVWVWFCCCGCRCTCRWFWFHLQQVLMELKGTKHIYEDYFLTTFVIHSLQSFTECYSTSYFHLVLQSELVLHWKSLCTGHQSQSLPIVDACAVACTTVSSNSSCRESTSSCSL